MKILVTGKSGQVARCLADKAVNFPQLDLIFAARPRLDLADEASIRSVMQEIQPDLVINAAAYTAVDQAEDEPEQATAINGIAPGILATEAKALGAPILHLSTDYVFDGSLDRPYVESDEIGPASVYGRSKMIGEAAIRAANPDHTIIRTAWVFSPYGNNFVKTMLKLGKARNELTIVDDQFGNPTSAHDIATVLLTIADQRRQGDTHGKGKTYHFGGGVETNWYGFAKEIFRIGKTMADISVEVSPVPSMAYPTKAIRPKNSRLNSAAILNDFDLTLDRDVMLQPEIVRAILQGEQT